MNPARETVAFTVGPSCDGCEDRIRTNLAEREGVCDDTAEVDARRVDVVYDPHETSADELADGIVDRGYDVGRADARTE